MENLNILSRDTLIKIILELDYQISNTESLERQNLQIMLNKAYRDLDEMDKTRLYWKDKYLELKNKYEPNPKRKVTKPAPTKEFTIRVIKKKVSDDKPIVDYKEPVFNESNDSVEPSDKMIIKGGYSHNRESSKGNVKRTKHSAHKDKKELLQVKFPDGSIKCFKKS